MLAVATTARRSWYAEPMKPAPTAAPRWLDDTEMSAWRGYVELIGALNSVMDAELAPFGLSVGDYEVLVNLSEAEHQHLRMCDLAARLRLSPSGLTRRLDGLVRAGLVSRVPSPDDRRAMFAALTDAGVATLQAAAPDHLASVRRHFVDLLTRDEIEHLASAFTKVHAALANEQNRPPCQ